MVSSVMSQRLRGVGGGGGVCMVTSVSVWASCHSPEAALAALNWS